MTRRAILLALAVLAASARAAPATPEPTPAVPAAPRTTAKPKAAKPRSTRPPLDFTGVWEIDPKASRGVSKNMEGAVLSVRQNGNRIWIEPVGQKHSQIVAEQIVVDGRLYEKALGGGQKGTLEAAWGKDGETLWLEAVAGTDENPRAATQRMIWRLRDGGKTWTRQTRTIQVDGISDTFLVFRKRAAGKN